MKLVICAIAALSVSLTHSLFKENVHPDQPSHAAEMIHLNNHEEASGFHMVANTESNVTYQSWYSDDQKTWHKANHFQGNGNMKVISFSDVEAGNKLFVKIEQL